MKSEYDCVITNNFTLTDSGKKFNFFSKQLCFKKKTAAYHFAIDNKAVVKFLLKYNVFITMQ